MNIYDIIRQSLKAPDGKESSTRIAGYILLYIIVLFSLSFMFIFICLALTKGLNNYMVIIFGMILTHHLTLLGINKFNETKQKKDKEL